ncbi:methylosome subunit pICln [Agrilus planipennis]|uniref:Methylosome subunit pICln n=1 Tax=Agrilus planipennis TaxID=224129 RepID=A0A1W4XUH4_AGRPL|nr:methylosome subunit pICln [Agrilus planipennis]
MVVVSSFQAPDSPVVFEHRNTQAIFDKKDLGPGTVYVSERTLCWKDVQERGFTISYNHISMHAKSSDLTIYPTPCIYIMIDTHVTLPGESSEPVQNDEDSEAGSEADISELILVPSDLNTLDDLYESIKQCQALNPDPSDIDEDDMYEDAEDQENMVIGDMIGGGDADMDHLSDRLRDHSVNIQYDHSNGDYNVEEEHFEDAD